MRLNSSDSVEPTNIECARDSEEKAYCERRQVEAHNRCISSSHSPFLLHLCNIVTYNILIMLLIPSDIPYITYSSQLIERYNIIKSSF